MDGKLAMLLVEYAMYGLRKFQLGEVDGEYMSMLTFDCGGKVLIRFDAKVIGVRRCGDGCVLGDWEKTARDNDWRYVDEGVVPNV